MDDAEEESAWNLGIFCQLPDVVADADVDGDVDVICMAVGWRKDEREASTTEWCVVSCREEPSKTQVESGASQRAGIKEPRPADDRTAALPRWNGDGDVATCC
ncbi:hypothetical protein EG329_008361 [Mollisiaceae sp. DMI_Dod_QoI]|nr:hypothetical protein EG329_008361 [Helotiales sp. DMI_Dod_QoI]